ncbi:unnamed protein product, partial [Ectocarpus sp. 8 AP-2014]
AHQLGAFQLPPNHQQQPGGLHHPPFQWSGFHPPGGALRQPQPLPPRRRRGSTVPRGPGPWVPPTLYPHGTPGHGFHPPSTPTGGEGAWAILLVETLLAEDARDLNFTPRCTPSAQHGRPQAATPLSLSGRHQEAHSSTAREMAALRRLPCRTTNTKEPIIFKANHDPLVFQDVSQPHGRVPRSPT